MSRGQKWLQQAGHCFPRVSGDEPDGVIDRLSIGLFSPRERG